MTGHQTISSGAPSGLLRELLPREVRVVEIVGSPDLRAQLLPAEAAVVARASAQRQRDFAAGRVCARSALSQIGADERPLVPGTSGAPAWPAGVHGSLTHCAGHAAAAVCRSGVFASLGVDAEPDQPLPEGVLTELAGANERSALSALPHGPSWDRVFFSAKESLYKAWFPVTGRWLDFRDALVHIREDGRWTAEILVPGALRHVRGRYTISGGLVVTAATVMSEDVLW